MQEDRAMQDRTFISVPFDMSQIPNANYIPDKPGELYSHLIELRNWRDKSSRSERVIG